MNQKPDDNERLVELAERYGVSLDVVQTLLHALLQTGGRSAQFHHPELGGFGQWMSGGMVMVGEMNNHALKSRVDSLCKELSELVRQAPDRFARSFPSQDPPVSARTSERSSAFNFGASLFPTQASDPRWPSEWGTPSSSGRQNRLSYAVFPASRRLWIEQDGQIALFDTLDHRISGVSQRQGDATALLFTSQKGTLPVADLPRLPVEDISTPSVPAEPVPSAADTTVPLPAAPGGTPARPAAGSVGKEEAKTDPLERIEQLARLLEKGILSEEEFTAKKRELLDRI